MTDRLTHLFHDEGERIDVPPPPTDAILATARRRRRARQRRSAFAAAASVAVLVGGLVGVGTLALGDGGDAPDVATPATPTPTPQGGTDAAAPLELSGGAVGHQAFGSDAGTVRATVTARLGEPDVTVGPERWSRRPGGGDTWVQDPTDPTSPGWGYATFSVSCWQTFCLFFGGEDADSLRLRGWELAEYRRWSPPGDAEGSALPAVRLAGSGIRLGDSWRKLHAAYPGTVTAGAEGASLAVRKTPWPTIFDGVAGWRLSGQWDHQHPSRVPQDAVVTRLSGGEGPEPGCC